MTSDDQGASAGLGAPLCFLHGVGGPRGDGWTSSLNSRLRQLGLAEVAPGVVRSIKYLDWLRPGRPRSSDLRPVVLSPEQNEIARGHHEKRADDLRALARPRADPRPRVEVGDLHQSIRRPLARTIRKTPKFREAELYRKDAVVRANVLTTVLEQLPTTPYVLVAHSLGSHVAADLLQYLPAPSPLAMLVTIGSPLSSTGIMQRTISELTPFPFAKVGCWVNIYSRWDYVTSGKPLGRRITPVVDLPVDPPLSRVSMKHHGRTGYMGHPVTVTVIAEGLSWASAAGASHYPDS